MEVEVRVEDLLFSLEGTNQFQIALAVHVHLLLRVRVNEETLILIVVLYVRTDLKLLCKAYLSALQPPHVLQPVLLQVLEKKLGPPLVNFAYQVKTIVVILTGKVFLDAIKNDSLGLEEELLW